MKKRTEHGDGGEGDQSLIQKERKHKEFKIHQKEKEKKKDEVMETMRDKLEGKQQISVDSQS